MTLLILGILFLVGLLADVAGKLTPLPRVTLLLLSGIVIGPIGVDLIPDSFVAEWFPVLTTLALSMVGFLMGQKLSAQELRIRGRIVSLLALGKVFGAAAVVFTAVYLFTSDTVLALILAGIATTTAPAATFDVLQEMRARKDAVDEEFSSNLVGVVALDDAYGLIIFSVTLAAADILIGNGGSNYTLIEGLVEALSSIFLGALLGVPMAYITGRLDFGEGPIQAEAYGFVLVCAGVTSYLEFSPILAAMSMGSVVASLAKHHSRPFDAIEGMEWPFLILFFVLAGASFVPDGFGTLSVLTLLYVIARGVGTYVGTYGAATAMALDKPTRHWMGLTLLPQAGVALGIALIASQRLPQYEAIILPIILSATIILEVGSPVITRSVLRRVSRTSPDH